MAYMSETTLPPRRPLYFLNQAPAVALTAAQLDALDNDPEGVALVKAIHDRKADE
jgi:hypothetical protein